MGVSNSGLRDEADVRLNPPADESTNDAPSLPKRPADSAVKAEWVAYVVALGADEAFVSGDTDHWSGDPDDGETVTEPGLTKDELVDLANRLGG